MPIDDPVILLKMMRSSVSVIIYLLPFNSISYTLSCFEISINQVIPTACMDAVVFL